MQRPESLSRALGEIKKELCALRIDDASVSVDADGMLSVDEIVLAPKNGTKYRLVLASAPEEYAALALYEAHGGKVNAETPPATIDSWFEDGDA